MRKSSRPSGKKIALIILNAVLSVVFVVLLGATVYVEWILGRLYQDPAQTPTLSSEEIEAILDAEPVGTKPADMEVLDRDKLQWEQPEKVDPEEYIFNVLLLGQDRRPGETRARTDTMILITINTNTDTVTLTSFMRDLFVKIPGYYDNRLNVPYVFGGVELLYDTLELNFGIRPDRYVEVDFEGFEQIVDLVGGVEMYVSAGEAEFMNTYWTWGMTEGTHLLTGEQALAYARNRTTGGNGDFGRTERQRKVIAALIEKATELNLVEMNELLLTVSELVHTDMTSAELLSYAVRFYPVLSNLDEVNNVQIPYGDHFYAAWAEDIGAVIVPNLEVNSAIIAEYQK